MNKKQKKELIEKAEDSTLWVLELRLGKQNLRLLTLVGQGVKSSDNKWRRIIEKRNIYRNILLKKLNSFKKGELDNESNPCYEDYLRSANYNKFGEEDLKDSNYVK